MWEEGKGSFNPIRDKCRNDLEIQVVPNSHKEIHLQKIPRIIKKL